AGPFRDLAGRGRDRFPPRPGPAAQRAADPGPGRVHDRRGGRGGGPLLPRLRLHGARFQEAQGGDRRLPVRDRGQRLMTGRPIVLQGVGRLGSAILEGWLATGAVDPADLIILTPSEKPAAEAARAKGARINPPLEELAKARAFVIGVKPAKWRE